MPKKEKQFKLQPITLTDDDNLIIEVDAEKIVADCSVKELLNLNLENEKYNIVRTHTIAKILFQKVMELEKRIQELEEK